MSEGAVGFSAVLYALCVRVTALQVFQEKNASPPTLNKTLEEGKQTILRIATKVAECQVRVVAKEEMCILLLQFLLSLVLCGIASCQFFLICSFTPSGLFTVADSAIQLECGMKTPVDVYLEAFHFGLVEVVYEWARGTPFADITCKLQKVFCCCCVWAQLVSLEWKGTLLCGNCSWCSGYFVCLRRAAALTDVLEGSIVRCITRLDETCRQVAGNTVVLTYFLFWCAV